jgi:tetratricopeptide (TPR) repeat protein
MDAQRRLQMNPPQLKPGEDVKIVDNRVQVSGQVAVMSINGLLTKVIFDHNPKNEFFVEESFPLDWMYPYLSPFGIIMKINRQKLPEISEDMVQRDHSFWKQFSKRLTGDIVDYDTPVTNITAWIEKTYLRRNFKGFTGAPEFVRDDQGQKAFSKLRSSIGGIYAWRISDPENHNPIAQQRMIKEADFAFKQAFAFCPYSPEAVFRYVNLLLSPYMNRLDDALAIATTCRKLDPYNGQVIDLCNRLETFKKQQAQMGTPAALANMQQMEKNVMDNPTNYQAAFNLAGAYMQAGQADKAYQILDRVMNDPHADPAALRTLVEAYANNPAKLQEVVGKFDVLVHANSNNFAAMLGLAEAYRRLQETDKAQQALDQVLNNPSVDANSILLVAKSYADLGNMLKLESSLEKLVKVTPDSPEAWYDLSALRATMGKGQEALSALGQALELNAKRLKQEPKARDLLAETRKDERFAGLRQNPTYQSLMEGKPLPVLEDINKPPGK